jgi:hypothetical protein
LHIYPDDYESPDDAQNETYDIPGFHAVTYSQEEAFDASDWAYDIAMYFTLAYVAEVLASAFAYAVLVVKKFKETK